MPGFMASLMLPDFGTKGREAGVQAALAALTVGGPAYIYVRDAIDGTPNGSDKTRTTSTAHARAKGAASRVVLATLEADGTERYFYVVPCNPEGTEAYSDAKAHPEAAAVFAIDRATAMARWDNPKTRGSVVMPRM